MTRSTGEGRQANAVQYAKEASAHTYNAWRRTVCTTLLTYSPGSYFCGELGLLLRSAAPDPPRCYLLPDADAQVSYSHPAPMKREEEYVPVWSEKRLLQLNFLFQARTILST